MRQSREGRYIFVIEDVENPDRLARGRPVAYITDINIISRLLQGESVTASAQQPGILMLFFHRIRLLYLLS